MSSNDDDRCGGDAASDIKRRAYHRGRRGRAAADKRHLPSLRELALGSPWYGSSMLEDAMVWSERGIHRIDKGSDVGAALCNKLAALTSSPSPHDFQAARDEVEWLLDPVRSQDYRGPDLVSMFERLEFYCSGCGWPNSCLRVAQGFAEMSMKSDCPSDESALLLEAALGWLCASRTSKPLAFERALRHDGIVGLARRDADRLGHIAIREILDAYSEPEIKPPVPPVRREGTLAAAVKAFDIAAPLSLRDMMNENAVKLGDAVIVCKEIGSPGTMEGKRVAEAYGPIVGKALPLALTPDLDVVRHALASEFPHAVNITDAILNAREHVHMRPTVLVSAPGTGKTTYAIRLLELLGVAHQVYSCGGVSDASFAGTPRQWASGGVSAPMSLIARHKTASPGIILDECQRVASGRHNGNLLDALVGMLEPVSARRWLDPYLQSECDLSHVLWLATANDLEGVPLALRDRFRVLRFPEPGPEHLDVLADTLMRREIEERGLPAAWALPLDGLELSMLAEHWRGGSIRKLSRLVRGVLDARDMPSVGRA